MSKTIFDRKVHLMVQGMDYGYSKATLDSGIDVAPGINVGVRSLIFEKI